MSLYNTDLLVLLSSNYSIHAACSVDFLPFQLLHNTLVAQIINSSRWGTLNSVSGYYVIANAPRSP